MANLPNDRDAAQRAGTTYRGSTDRVPLTYARDIAHDAAVPGSTDTDGDSWREHQEDGLSANREAIRQVSSRVETLGNFIDDEGFAIGTGDQAAAGYGYQARDGQVGANASLALFPANQSTILTADASGNVVLYIRVPAGVDPDVVRIDHRRGNSLLASYPRRDADAWGRFSAFTGRSPHYDYYILVDGSLGSTVGISGALSGDTFDMRIHIPASAISTKSLLTVIPDDQEQLFAATEYEGLKVIFWRGEFYQRSEGTGVAARLRIGALRGRSFGYFGGSYGQFLLNPSRNFQQFNQHTTGSLQVHLLRSAWRAAKESNEASGDNFQMTITLEEDTTQTETITMTYSGVSLDEPRGVELEFLGSLSSLLVAANVNKVVSISLAYNGGAILEALENSPEWVPIELAQVHAAFQKLMADIEHLGDGNADARLRALEDKSSEISFDDQTEWAAADNTPVSGRYPYGRWAWIERGGNAGSYARQDYATMDSSGGDGFNGPGSGLVWVIPNNLNWSRVRLVIRRADGSIRSAVVAQSLRNMPSGIPVVNVPSGNPDETARWSASSDSAPYAVSNIEATDTIGLEVLAAAHTPVWEGELDTGQVATALVTLVADEGAYDALTSPEANRLYLW